MTEQAQVKEPVTCRSCQHSRWNWKNPASWGTEWAWSCSRVTVHENRDYNPVTGKIKVTPSHHDLCTKQRGRWGDCGEEGRHWQPKHAKDLFGYIKRIS